MTLTPTTLTHRHLRANGWPVVETVEHFNYFTKRKHDLLGMFDILAVGPDGTLAVQTTSASNVASRVRKITEHPNLPAVREAGWGVHVHGWAKRRGRWVLAREVDLS